MSCLYNPDNEIIVTKGSRSSYRLKVMVTVSPVHNCVDIPACPSFQRSNPHWCRSVHAGASDSRRQTLGKLTGGAAPPPRAIVPPRPASSLGCSASVVKRLPSAPIPVNDFHGKQHDQPVRPCDDTSSSTVCTNASAKEIK